MTNPFDSIAQTAHFGARAAALCPGDIHKRLTDPQCEAAYLQAQAEHYPAHVARHPNTPPKVLAEIFDASEETPIAESLLANPAFFLLSLEEPALYERMHSKARRLVARDALMKLAWERSGRYRKPKAGENPPTPTKAIYNAVLTYCARTWSQFAPVDPTRRRDQMLRWAAAYHAEENADPKHWAATIQSIRAQASRIRVAEPKRIQEESEAEWSKRAFHANHIRGLRATFGKLDCPQGRSPVGWLLHMSGVCIADQLGGWAAHDSPAWADELETHLRILQTGAFEVPGYAPERGLL